MALNLRGVRESGTFFAIPTYCFMVGILGMVGLRAVPDPGARRGGRRRTARSTASRPDPQYAAFTGFAMVALLARTFSSGCAALTGVEAISNGVPAFRKPKSKNAATTLLLLGTIAVTMLIGVVALANLTGLKLIDAGRLALHAERPAGRGRRGDGDRPAGPGGVRRLPARLLLRRHRHHDHLVPGREHRLQRLPGARARSWPGTATCPASCTPGATGWPTATASSCWPSSRSC